MRRTLCLRVIAAVVLCAGIRIASAQTMPNFSRIIIPVNVGRLHGLYGSEWMTDLSVTNLADAEVGIEDVPHPYGCPVDVCFGYTIPPRRTFYFDNSVGCTEDVLCGIVARVQTDRLKDLMFTLRTRDVNSASTTWGTTLPVVREEQFFATTFSIGDIPVDPQFRATLRIYKVDPTTVGQLRYRIYAVDATPNTARPDVLVGEFTASFAQRVPPGVPSYIAALAQVYLWTVPNLPASGRIRVELEPLDGKKEYWAFVSVTHNDTQHVTVITP